MKLVYLASPYSHRNQMVIELRARIITDVTAHLMAKHGEDITFYSPIAYGHLLVSSTKGKNIPKGWAWWARHDISMLKKSDAMWVVKLNDWDKSAGIKAEVSYCEQHRIPVEFIDFEDIGINNESID